MERGVAAQGQLALPKGHAPVKGGFQQAGLLKDLQDFGLLGTGRQEVVVLLRVRLEVEEQGGLPGGEIGEAAAGPVGGRGAVEGSWGSKERREAQLGIGRFIAPGLPDRFIFLILCRPPRVTLWCDGW